MGGFSGCLQAFDGQLQEPGDQKGESVGPCQEESAEEIAPPVLACIAV